jgi:hypothetical protein
MRRCKTGESVRIESTLERYGINHLWCPCFIVPVLKYEDVFLKTNSSDDLRGPLNPKNHCPRPEDPLPYTRKPPWEPVLMHFNPVHTLTADSFEIPTVCYNSDAC